jgi:hypothetical protein
MSIGAEAPGASSTAVVTPVELERVVDRFLRREREVDEHAPRLALGVRDRVAGGESDRVRRIPQEALLPLVERERDVDPAADQRHRVFVDDGLLDRLLHRLAEHLLGDFARHDARRLVPRGRRLLDVLAAPQLRDLVAEPPIEFVGARVDRRAEGEPPGAGAQEDECDREQPRNRHDGARRASARLFRLRGDPSNLHIRGAHANRDGNDRLV